MLPDHLSREMFEEVQRFGIVVLALLGLWTLKTARQKQQEEFFACSEARERSRYYSAFHRRGSD